MKLLSGSSILLTTLIGGSLLNVSDTIFAAEKTIKKTFACVAPLKPNTYYVAPNGNDSNPGTLSQPFLTVQHAASLAKPGETVVLRAGTYRETVVPTCSGTATNPITYQAYANEIPVISGTNLVTGWTSSSGSIYQAPMNWNLGVGANQVFVNGQMLFEAQWPAPTTSDFTNLSQPQARSTFQTGTAPVYVPNTTSTFATSSTDAKLTPPALLSGDTWNNANIHVQAANNSLYLFGNVTSLQPASGSTPGTIDYQLIGEGTTPTGYNLKFKATAGTKYYLTGLLSFLTAPGEWFYNATTQTLYLRTLTSQSPATMLIEAKARQFGFDLTQRSYITINGLSFFATGIQSNYSANYPESSHITLNNITAQYVSHQAALPSIFSTPLAGIRLMGSNNTLTDSQIYDSGNVGVYLYGNNNLVQNNIMHDVNYLDGTPDGAISVFGSGNQILNNTLYNAGYALIYSSYLQNVKILNNLVYDAMLQTVDGGDIYITGPDGEGTQIAENIIYNLENNPTAVGIYLDNNCRNFLINNNIVLSAATGVVLNAPSLGTIVQVNHKVYNNTIVPFCSNCTSFSSYTPLANNTLAGTEIKNNIIMDVMTMKKNMLAPVSQQPVFQNNVFTSTLTTAVYNYLTTAGNANTGNIYSTTTTIDPQFTAPYPSGYKYSLKTTSPAYALSQAIPTSVVIGPYTVPFIGIAAGAPAGACGSVPAWNAGATLNGSSPLNLCG